MLKKPRRVSRSYYEKKADALLQEIGRRTYKKCLVCGGDYSALHHFVYKSQSTALRYDWENCIPICNRCHFRIHNAKDDMVAGRIVAIKGKAWLDALEKRKKEGAGLKYGVFWFKEKFEYLTEILK